LKILAIKKWPNSWIKISIPRETTKDNKVRENAQIASKM
jgi:hypothetical protein